MDKRRHAQVLRAQKRWDERLPFDWGGIGTVIDWRRISRGYRSLHPILRLRSVLVDLCFNIQLFLRLAIGIHQSGQAKAFRTKQGWDERLLFRLGLGRLRLSLRDLSLLNYLLDTIAMVNAAGDSVRYLFTIDLEWWNHGGITPACVELDQTLNILLLLSLPRGINQR